MEVRAVGKYVRVQPRKVRIVADEVRGAYAAHAAALLRYHPSKGAFALRKVLVSAMANAAENHGVPPEALRIRTIQIDEGPRLKRLRARAMGRGNRILKKTSHITVIVEDAEPVAAVKAHGTKPKARPTLAAVGTKAKKGAAPKQTEAKPAEEIEVVTATAEEATPVTTTEASETSGNAEEGKE